MQARFGTDARVAIPWEHFRIPPFPQIALQVMKVANNDGTSMCQMADLVSSDPAFCSEVLTVANSAAIPHRFPVTSIQQAVAMLGTSKLKGLCLTVAVRSYLGESRTNPALRAIWVHSLASALIAQRLVLVGLIDDDTAYTGGLLHEIGRLALAILSPTDYAHLLLTHRGSSPSLVECEREMFGCDHRQLGRHLVAEWKLPSAFDAVVGPENRVRTSSDRTTLADLIHMSCRMATAAGFSAFSGCEVTPYKDLLEELPTPERIRFYSNVNDLAAAIGKDIANVDCATSDAQGY